MRADCFPIIQTPPPPPPQPPLRCHCSLISPLWTRNYYSAWITTMWRRQKKQLTPQRQEISHSVYDRIPRASGEAKRKEKAVRWHCTSTWDLIYTRKAQRMRSKTCQMWSSNKYLLNVALSHTLRLLPPASTIATPEPRSSNESGCQKPSLELFLSDLFEIHTLFLCRYLSKFCIVEGPLVGCSKRVFLAAEASPCFLLRIPFPAHRQLVAFFLLG